MEAPTAKRERLDEGGSSPKRERPDWVRLVTEPALREAALARARAEGGAAAAGADAKGERELLLARAFPHPRDKRIKFVEASHKYFLDGEAVPISVSGLWARYFDHFDADAALKNLEKWRENADSPYYYLLRHLDAEGVPRAEHGGVVKRVWEANGESASGAGTFMHRVIELFYNEETEALETAAEAAAEPAWRARKKSPFYQLLMHLSLVEKMPTEEQKRAAQTVAPPGTADYIDMLFAETPAPPGRSEELAQWEAWRASRPELIPVRTEMNVYSLELKFAGQLDGLFYDTAKKHFVIADWKRCRAIERVGFRGRKGKPPFDTLPDTNFGHYTVQQNLYRLLLYHWYGVDVRRLVLVQLHPQIEAFQEHEVPIMTEATNKVLMERAREVGSTWTPGNS